MGSRLSYLISSLSIVETAKVYLTRMRQEKSCNWSRGEFIRTRFIRKKPENSFKYLMKDEKREKEHVELSDFAIL